MILYETINTQRLSSEFPKEEPGDSDELYSSEALALMPLASYCPLDERQDPADWGVDHPLYPFFAFDGDDDEDEDIDEDMDDDFDDGFGDDDFGDDEDFDEDDYDDEDYYEYEDGVEEYDDEDDE